MTVAPLYARVLRDGWARLAAPVRSIHSAQPVVRAHGRFRVVHGRRRLARVLARLLRLPPACASTDTRLTVTAVDAGERWERTFDVHCLETEQYETDASELAEAFGVLELRFRLDALGDSLHYVPRGAALLWGSRRLPIPARLAPRVEAREDPAGPRRIDVHVDVTLPVVGPLIAYEGTVEVEDTSA